MKETFITIPCAMFATEIPNDRPRERENKPTRRLTPIEVITLAVIHGYSQHGAGCFYGGMDYLAGLLNVNRHTAGTAVNTLIDAGLVSVTTETLAGTPPTTRREYRSLWSPSGESSEVTPAAPEAPVKPSKKSPVKVDFVAALVAAGVTEQTAQDWLVVRKAAKAVNTQTALTAILNELKKAAGMGYTGEQCIRSAVAANWRGFRAEWLSGKIQPEVQAYGVAPAPAKTVSTDSFINSLL